MPTEQDLVPATPPTLRQLQEAIDLRIRRVTEVTPTEFDAENIESLGDGYVACIEAMRDAAVMAFNYVAAELGVTGFQASVAAIQAYGMEMSIDGPFMFVRLADALYPQYDIAGSVTSWINRADSREWLREEAKKRMAEVGDNVERLGHVSPLVWQRWLELAGE